MIHKEVEVQSKLKVVIALRSRKFADSSAIQSAIEAMDYEGKRHLRLRGNITGTGVILGNVMILDVNIPLNTTNSSDVTKHYDEFNMAVVKGLTYGTLHKTSGITLGKFGSLTVGYVSPTATRRKRVSVTVDTDLEVSEVVELLNSKTNVLATSFSYRD